MNMEYTIMQYKARDLMQEAQQRRLAHEAQTEDDAYHALAANLEKIRQQLGERYTRKPQLPIAPAHTEACCPA